MSDVKTHLTRVKVQIFKYFVFTNEKKINIFAWFTFRDIEPGNDQTKPRSTKQQLDLPHNFVGKQQHHAQVYTFSYTVKEFC